MNTHLQYAGLIFVLYTAILFFSKKKNKYYGKQSICGATYSYYNYTNIRYNQ